MLFIVNQENIADTPTSLKAGDKIHIAQGEVFLLITYWRGEAPLCSMLPGQPFQEFDTLNGKNDPISVAEMLAAAAGLVIATQEEDGRKTIFHLQAPEASPISNETEEAKKIN